MSASQIYQQQIQQYHRPQLRPSTYTWDRYFYNRPTISPYLNLMRRSGSYINNYYQYVVPQEIRRGQGPFVASSGAFVPPGGYVLPSGTAVSPLASGGQPGGGLGAPAPGRYHSSYYNQWYKSREQMGLAP